MPSQDPTGTRTAGRAGQLAPLRIESTPALVAARIRAGIFDRTFPPDGQLNEVELARDLGVSRGPVREAFQRLIHEGLLRAERNRGVFVVALDQHSMRDVYFVRDVIEQAAALRLAERHDEAGLGELERIVDSMKGAMTGDWSELVAIDLEFHRTLVAAAGSERLLRMFEPIYAETRLLLSYLEIHYDDRADLHDEHRGILAAISSGDDALIARLVHLHMTDSVAKLARSA
jgi:DNA-binding GntR family transcriptional regulator